MAEKRRSRYTCDSRESDEQFRQQMERDEKMRGGQDIPGPLRAMLFIVYVVGTVAMLMMVLK